MASTTSAASTTKAISMAQAMDFYSQGPTMLYDKHGLSGNTKCPDRGETMYLGVVRPKDVPPGQPKFAKGDDLSLRTHDIHGARTTFRFAELYKCGKPDLGEVKGSRPKQFWKEQRRVIDLPLTTVDIERAQPSASEFKTSRCVNPLEPKYDLPSFPERPPTPPEPRVHEGVMRDPLQHKGEWTPRILERNYARNPNESRDIEYTQPNLRKRMQAAAPREVMKTIEKAGERILSSKWQGTPRETNPLDPVYNACTRTTHPFRKSDVDTPYAPRQNSPIPGATPRQLHRDNGEPQASLIRDDLPGAMPQAYKGCLPFSIYDPPEITPISRHTQLDCSDIDGAQTGTRKRH
mmetsp:Transcript_109296/g.172227  ORF Transcript_109296/g.172227 Transcript_109296/m.172227 type:complete len:349 (+) Transcript_109296:60-1106(+)